MEKKDIKAQVADLLTAAGICLNGSRPCDPQIHHPDFYQRVLKGSSLGLGESYMDQWWDCERLDQFFERLLEADIENRLKPSASQLIKLALQALVNPQSKKQALTLAKQHYDLGNNLFQATLDPSMSYTCGYWKNANTLEEAQRAKLELSCQKMQLKPGMRVLDIGCGFGAFAKYAAKTHGVHVVGITISKEQYQYAQKNCEHLPIEIRFQDYRDLKGKFDRVVSLGMFEHVGPGNYRTYLQIVRQCLADTGLFLLHTIGNNISTFSGDPWINRYIFPHGVLPSIAQIGKASEGLLVMEDWQNFGADYDRTLMAWHANFLQGWDTLKNDYPERFKRMWSYYLLSCAGTFRARRTQLWQIVFSSNGLRGGYNAPR